jgi:hypothetical protein
LGAPEGGPIAPLDSYNNEFPANNNQPDDKKSNTMTYLLIGAAAVGAFFILKK